MESQLMIRIEDPGSSQERLDSSTRELLRELREMSVVEDASLQSTAAEPGTKAIEFAIIGSVLIKVLPQALPSLVQFLQSWASRRQGRTIKLKVQRAGGAVDVEYPVETITEDQVADITRSLVKILDTPPQRKPGRPRR